jgi:hypothetical protein
LDGDVDGTSRLGLEIAESSVAGNLARFRPATYLAGRYARERAEDWLLWAVDAARYALGLALEKWRNRDEEGRLHRDPSISAEQRKSTITTLSAVAAAALVMDTLEVKFTLFKAADEPRATDEPQAAADPKPLVPIDAGKARMGANLGARLGIVETLRSGVRFRHSIMQAYLGSRWIREHKLEQDDYLPYLKAGLKNGGREFLMALTMASASFAPWAGGATRRNEVLRRITQELCTAAKDDD